MYNALTLEDIKAAVAIAKKHEVKPLVLKTKKDVARANRQSLAFAEAFGTRPHKWKIGDKYYLFHYCL